MGIALRAFLSKHVVQEDKVQVEQEWTGIMADTPDQLPLVGSLPHRPRMARARLPSEASSQSSDEDEQSDDSVASEHDDRFEDVADGELEACNGSNEFALLA